MSIEKEQYWEARIKVRDWIFEKLAKDPARTLGSARILWRLDELMHAANAQTATAVMTRPVFGIMLARAGFNRLAAPLRDEDGKQANYWILRRGVNMTVAEATRLLREQCA